MIYDFHDWNCLISTYCLLLPLWYANKWNNTAWIIWFYSIINRVHKVLFWRASDSAPKFFLWFLSDRICYNNGLANHHRKRLWKTHRINRSRRRVLPQASHLPLWLNRTAHAPLAAISARSLRQPIPARVASI